MDMLSGQNAMQGGQVGVGVVGQQAQVQPQVGTVVPVQATTQAQVGSQNSQVLFTQEQVNSIVGGRVNPLNQRVSDLTAQLTQSQQVANSYLTELNAYKQRDAARNAGVPEMFIDFAVFEATKLMSGGKEFNTALNEFLTANKQMFGTQGAVGQQVPTMPAQAGVQPVIQPNGVAQQTSMTPAQQTVAGGKAVTQVSQQMPGQQPQVMTQQSGFVQHQMMGQQAGFVQPQMTPQVVAQPGQTQVMPQQMQVGASGVVGVMGNMPGVNQVDEAVNALLVSKGVKKIGG